MAESIKFDDKYIDTTGVYDSSIGKDQQVINADRISDIASINTALTPVKVTPAAYEKLLVNAYSVTRSGNVIVVSAILHFEPATANEYHGVFDGLPKSVSGVQLSVPNEYGYSGVCTVRMAAGSGYLEAKCTAANAYYYFTLTYITSE